MKVNCTNPHHTDTNPSMHVYDDRAYCFSCGFSVPSEEVVSLNELNRIKKEPEDVNSTLHYIRQCPIRSIRGLEFHYDSTGYFILWPAGVDFYKKRLFKGDTRYIGPRGRRAPLFEIPGNSKTCCIVVEGEVNALSLSLALGNMYPIFSPGSANEFLYHTNKYLTFDQVCCILDKDKPGVIAGLKTKTELRNRGKKVHLVACEKDCNQILQDEGIKGLQDWFGETLEML